MTDEPIKWTDIKDKSRAAGVLSKQFYVVFTSPAGPMGAILENLPAHLAFQKDLEARGIMFAAGPFADDAEEYWEAHGMVILRADSLADARAIADSDPMHKSGARTYRIRPWLMNEGSYSVRVTYSDGGREIT